jgi:transposase
VLPSEEQRVETEEHRPVSFSARWICVSRRLILMLAEGASFNTIKRQLRTTAPTISRWKARFLDSGMDGLDTHHPGQSASVLTPTLRARILSATRRSRGMDRHIGVAANWRRSWVSAKTLCVGPGKRPD